MGHFDLRYVEDYGHQSVIVFFVLSGYVIANVAEARETTSRAFLVARFARLWSVLVPAMALTLVCDTLGRAFGHNLDAYSSSPIDYPFVRLGAALTFMSQSWVSIQPFSDYAAWSLSLEFWYYIIFAAAWFLPAGRYRVAGIGLAMLFSGHKGLLLMPAWLMGMILQRSARLRRLGATASVSCFLGGFLALCWLGAPSVYWWARGVTAGLIGPWLTYHFAEARAFWYDWILALAFTVHLAGARWVMGRIPIERVALPIRWCAGISFASYLFHMPLLALFAAFLSREHGLLAVGMTLTAICLLGPPVERSKGWWRRLIEQGLNSTVLHPLAKPRFRAR